MPAGNPEGPRGAGHVPVRGLERRAEPLGADSVGRLAGGRGGGLGEGVCF